MQDEWLRGNGTSAALSRPTEFCQPVAPGSSCTGAVRHSGKLGQGPEKVSLHIVSY
jgi:hypothetical protein